MPYLKHLLDAQDYEDARTRVKSTHLNKHSYLGPDGQLKGALGEIAFERLLKHLQVDFTYVNDTKFDYEINFNNQIITADVKTKARNFKLKPQYEGSIPEYVAGHQEYDFAIFTSLLINADPLASMPFSLVQIGGMATKQLLLQKGYPQKAGQDDFGCEGNKCKFDCRNIRFKDMVDPVHWFKSFGISLP